MAIEDPNELERVDQEIRINELEEAIKEATGEEMTSYASPDCPPHIRESFLANVLAYETAGWITTAEQLARAGVELTPADQMDDATLTKKLWEVINKLGELRVFLSSTDHLSDRELYKHLCEISLQEETADLPPDPDRSYHIDILGACSEQDMFLHHKYYADEEDRQHWQKEWPGDPMPPHEDPPYDRDRRLPKGHH